MHCTLRRPDPKMVSSLVSLVGTDVVTLEEFKKHIRWDDSDDTEDTLMMTYIGAAASQAESYTGRAILSGNWKTNLDFFADVTLDVAPVTASTIVVKYYDVNNDLQTLVDTEYSVRDDGYMVSIEFDGTMPELYDRYGAVQIEYTAGYTDVPDAIKTAVMIQAAGYFENRQSEIGGTSNPIIYGFHQLLFPYKML